VGRFGPPACATLWGILGQCPTPNLAKCPIFNGVIFGAGVAPHICANSGLQLRVLIRRAFPARPREEVEKMIANEKNPALNQEATVEEEELLKRSSAPTVLDLRAALKDRFPDIDRGPDSTSPNDRLPQPQPDWLFRSPATDRR
jgi:hypothetical protein